MQATRPDDPKVLYLIDMIKCGENIKKFRLAVMQFQLFAFLNRSANAISAYYESLPDALSWDMQMVSYRF